jgi:hypothetical protein
MALWQTSEGNHAGIRCLFNRIKIMEKQSASRAGAAIGAMIFSVFGSGWLLAWAIRSFAQAAVLWALIAAWGWLCLSRLSGSTGAIERRMRLL